MALRFITIFFIVICHGIKAQTGFFQIDKIEFPLINECSWGDILLAKNAQVELVKDMHNSIEIKKSKYWSKGLTLVDIYRPQILLPDMIKNSVISLNFETKSVGGGQINCIVKLINESEEIVKQIFYEIESTEKLKLNEIKIPIDKEIKAITYNIIYSGKQIPLQSAIIKDPVVCVDKKFLLVKKKRKIRKKDITLLGDSELFQSKPNYFLKNSSIIGLGEPTHGSKTVKSVRFDICRSLIQYQNVKIVALECPIDLGLIFNSYVQGYADSSSLEVIKQNSKFLMDDVDLLCSFLNWVRKSNSTLPKEQRTHVIGIDQPTPYIWVNILENSIELYKKGNISLEDLNNISCRKKSYLSSNSLKNDSIFLTVFNQALSHLTRERNNIYYQRDSLMNLNILELYGLLQPSEKIIILAHSNHLSKINYDKERNLGVFLSCALGNKYHNITIQFGNGTYVQDSCYIAGNYMIDTLLKNAEGSFEQMSLESGNDYFYCLTKDIPPFSTYASIPRYFYGKQIFRYKSKKRFDAFLFLKESEHFNHNSISTNETAIQEWHLKEAAVKLFLNEENIPF